VTFSKKVNLACAIVSLTLASITDSWVALGNLFAGVFNLCIFLVIKE
jgi:hypothetical protein